MNQGTKWVLLMKKNRSQKSPASVPLSFIAIMLRFIFALSYYLSTLGRNVIASTVLVIALSIQEPLSLLTVIALSLQISVIAYISYRFSLFGSAFQLLQFLCVQKYRIDFKLFSPNKLLIKCNIYIQSQQDHRTYLFQILYTGSKVISVQHCSVIAITVCYILCYHIMLYHSIAKLSFGLNFCLF